MSLGSGDLIAVGGAPSEPAAPIAEGEAAKKIEGRSPWRLAMERLRRDRASMISLGVIVFIVLVAIFAPWSPRSPVTGSTSSSAPSA